MSHSLDKLRIIYGDETNDIVIPLHAFDGGNFLTLNDDYPIELPNGERVAVYAEAGPNRTVPDVSLSVVEDGRVFGVRAGYGAILTFTTKGGFEFMLQLGTGAWEE